MKHFIGLDVSVKETAVCIVDELGKICREVKIHSHPDDLLAVMKDPSWNIERVGLEAGPLSQWLFEGLAEPARCASIGCHGPGDGRSLLRLFPAGAQADRARH